MKNIFLAQPEELRSWEIGLSKRISERLSRESVEKKFTLVDSPQEAEIIIFLESNSHKNHTNTDYFNRLIGQWSPTKKVLVLNYEDKPPGVLPGMYTSLESFKFDKNLHVSWPHLQLPNAQIHERRDNLKDGFRYLFSFSGSCSHPIRRKAFNLFSTNKQDIRVNEVDKWYNHSPEEKTAYVDEILDSAFVLCPRGRASYSHRIIETMALGRVPVILGDHWVPFDVDETGYFIRIPEKELARTEEILRKAVGNYDQFRTNVMQVYAKYFEADGKYTVAINKLCELSENIPGFVDQEFLLNRLKSRKFHRMNEWLRSQRIRVALGHRWDRLKKIG